MNKSDNMTAIADKAYVRKQENMDLERFSSMVKLNWGNSIETGATTPASPYDCSARKTMGDSIIELKSRDCPHDKYTTSIIECDKYAEGLMYHVTQHFTPIYVCFYNDGVAMVWNLLDNCFPPKAAKRSAKNPGYNTEENNVAYFLPAYKAKRLRWMK